MGQPDGAVTTVRVLHDVRDYRETGHVEQSPIFVGIEAAMVEVVTLEAANGFTFGGPAANISAARGSACAWKRGNMRH